MTKYVTLHIETYLIEEVRIPLLIPPLLRGDAEGRGDQILLKAIVYYATCLIAGTLV